MIREYFEYQDKYEKKYGNKIIVLMEVGSFIEIYSIENDSVKKGRMSEIENNWMVCWYKKRKFSEYNVEQVQMVGSQIIHLISGKNLYLKKVILL